MNDRIDTFELFRLGKFESGISIIVRSGSCAPPRANPASVEVMTSMHSSIGSSRSTSDCGRMSMEGLEGSSRRYLGQSHTNTAPVAKA